MTSESVVAPPAALSSPFVGLEPYREEDARFFFGREQERRIIAANLRSSRLTLLYGASGVGKSSVLRAGVLHQMRRRMLADAQTRGDPSAPAPLVAVYFGAWRDPDPVQVLLKRIRLGVEEAVGGELEPPAPGEDVLDVLGRFNSRVRSILVILDQFEEYFLYHRETGSGTWNDEFPRIVDDARLRVHFLISIRQDALAQLDQFKAKIPDLFSNYLRLEHLGREAAGEAIASPVAVYNEVHELADPYTVEPALIEAVLDGALTDEDELTSGGDAKAEPAEPRIESPFLQLVMERLWAATCEAGLRTLSIKTLDDLGGAREIVRKHVEHAMAGLGDDRRAVAADLLRFLVTSQKSKIAQRASDLALWTERTEDDVIDVLQQLAGAGSARVLRPLPPAPGERTPRYEIFHDVLAEPLLEWRRRFQAEQDAAVLEHRLEEEKSERLAAEQLRHDAQVNRIVRWALVGMGLLTVALGVAVFYALRERSMADSRRIAAEAVVQLGSDPEQSITLASDALQQHRTREAEDALRLALGMSHVRWTGSPGDGVRKIVTSDGTATATLGRRSAQRWTGTTPPRRAAAPLTEVGEAGAVALSRDGAVLAVGGEGGAKVQLGDREVVLTQSPTKAVAVSADGRYVATAGRDSVDVWDAARGTPLKRRPVARGPFTLVFDPSDPERLGIASCAAGHTVLWDWRSGDDTTLESNGAKGEVAPCVVSFSPDGRRIVTAIGETDTMLWDADANTTVDAPLDFLESGPPSDELIAWTRDSKRFALAAGPLAIVYEAKTGDYATATDRMDDIVTSVAFSPDGTLLATGTQDGLGMISDVRTGVPLLRLRGHIDTIASVRFVTPTTVMTASDDGKLKVWDVSTGTSRGEQRPGLTAAAFSPDGRSLASTGAEGTFVTPVAGGASVQVKDSEIEDRTAVMFSSDSKSVIVGGNSDERGLVVVADARSGEQLKALEEPTAQLRSFDVSAATNLAAVTLQGRGTRLYGVRNWRQPERLEPLPGGAASTARFDRDGTRLVTAGTDGVARVYDAQTHKLLRKLEGHSGWLTGAVFSNDGSRILSFGFDRTARIWDSRTGENLHVLSGHTSWIKSGAFAPGGRTIVTSGSDGTVRVWNASTGRLQSIAHPHAGKVVAVQYSPDGRSILTAGTDGMVKLGQCEICGSADHVLELAAERLRQAR